MTDFDSAVRPFSKCFTGQKQAMSWGTKTYFVWRDAHGVDIANTGGWELRYDNEQQRAEHERARKESAETQ
jgi:hypothetical protein